MSSDWTRLCEQMLQEQIVNRGITTPAVLEAMRSVPRHRFVSTSSEAEAYSDHPISIGNDQTISQPYMVALMTASLAPKKNDRVLEVGTGSGYQAAILSHLTREVFSIERHPELAAQAQARFSALGIENVRVIQGDGSGGLPEHAPFDGIMVTAGGPRVPKPLIRQLAVGGRLVCPAGDQEIQHLYTIVREDNGYRTTKGTQCKFVPLVGAQGWQANADR